MFKFARVMGMTLGVAVQAMLGGMPVPRDLHRDDVDGQVIITVGSAVLFSYDAADAGLRILAAVTLPEMGFTGRRVAQVLGITEVYVSMLRTRARAEGSGPQHRHVHLGDPQHLCDPAAGEAHLGQRHRCQVAQPGIGGVVAEQHGRPDGDDHLAVDVVAVQVAWDWHAPQHGLYRNPQRHTHDSSKLKHISQIISQLKPQVTGQNHPSAPWPRRAVYTATHLNNTLAPNGWYPAASRRCTSSGSHCPSTAYSPTLFSHPGPAEIQFVSQALSNTKAQVKPYCHHYTRRSESSPKLRAV